MTIGQNFGFAIGFCRDSGSQTAYQVDSAFVFETSGEAAFVRFVSPVDQTSGNLTVYFYASAITGSPTFDGEVRNGPGTDADRPENAGATLDTVAGVVPVAGTWSAFSFTNTTLVKGQQYYVVIKNAHATPASNYASWVYRGAADAHVQATTNEIFQTGYTTDGFATDPSVAGASFGTAVVKFNDTSLIGFPYLASESHASNTNDRGNRINFLENIKILGHQFAGTTTSMDNISVYQGASSIETIPTDVWAENRAASALYGPRELTKAINYDFVMEFASNSTSQTIFTMGEAEGDLPADVLACRPAGGYVDGAAGSYTVDTSKVVGMYIYVSDLVAAVGGSASGVRNPLGGPL